MLETRKVKNNEIHKTINQEIVVWDKAKFTYRKVVKDEVKKKQEKTEYNLIGSF